MPFDTAINFEKVGPEEGQYKYSYATAQTVKPGKSDEITLIGGQLTEKFSEITMKDGDLIVFVINLLEIKKEVDVLIQG
jgi:hypothetical protein